MSNIFHAKNRNHTEVYFYRVIELYFITNEKRSVSGNDLKMFLLDRDYINSMKVSLRK